MDSGWSISLIGSDNARESRYFPILRAIKHVTEM